jgi:hypothetical protein
MAWYNSWKSRPSLPPSEEAVTRITKTLEGTTTAVENLSSRTNTLEGRVNNLDSEHSSTVRLVGSLVTEVDRLKTIPFDPTPYDQMDERLTKVLK